MLATACFPTIVFNEQAHSNGNSFCKAYILHNVGNPRVQMTTCGYTEYVSTHISA